MKTIYNIFSKETQEKNKEKQTPEKIKIIIDYREKNSLIASELIALGLVPEFKHLKVADYIVKDVAIERKTIQDFISSMINKRLLLQLRDLQQYEKKLLIIEGFENQELYELNSKFQENENLLHPNSIRGFLLSISLKHKIPIIFSKNPEDTATYINLIARKKSTELSLNATKKPKNKKEQLQFILEGFPGIGPKTSKKLLQEFSSLKKIINASEEQLTKILGKKTQIFKQLLEENY
jgi:ERCC4-type nuclease